MKIHPAAEIFPVMTDEEYQDLKANIKEYGLMVPITTSNGSIVDGRNRERACRELNIELKTVELNGTDPVDFVWMMNFHRRNLDTNQKGMAAAKKATLKRGDNQYREQDAHKCATSQSQAADEVGVSRRTVQNATKVIKSGVPELVKAVETREVSVTEAASIASLEPDEQRELIILPKKERRKKTKVKRERAKQRKLAQAEVPFRLTGGTAKVVEPYYTIEMWGKLAKIERQKIIDAGFESKAKMNVQETASIEWARLSLNTVTGCKHDCPYCYARDFAERYFPVKFEPAFYPVRLSAPANQKASEETDPSYKNIFANSMSDLFGKWVPGDWIDATIEMARRNSDWNFLVLTKFPQRAADFEFPKNWWMGTTVDAQARVNNAEKAFEKIRCGTKWLSCEPLLEPLKFSRLDLFQWIVIGGASRSTQTPEWNPPFDWLAKLHEQGRAAGCRIYHKTNCGLLDEMRVREFPWSEPKIKSLPKQFRYLKGM